LRYHVKNVERNENQGTNDPISSRTWDLDACIRP
jgi:hypothetical protein